MSLQVVQQVLDRELAPWETIAIGGLSGGLAAVATTPFDVMKTRTMTAGPGMPSTMGAIMVAIVQQEGLLALFKGALPRFFWIAPLGAMNFAGYELAKRAMEEKNKELLDFSSHEVRDESVLLFVFPYCDSWGLILQAPCMSPSMAGPVVPNYWISHSEDSDVEIDLSYIFWAFLFLMQVQWCPC